MDGATRWKTETDVTYSKYIDHHVWHTIGTYTFTNPACGASATVSIEVENASLNSHIYLSNNGKSLKTIPNAVPDASIGVPVNVVVTVESVASDTIVILDQ